MRHRDALLFLGVSLVTLAIVETALLKTVGRPYTDLYRATRQHQHWAVRVAPLLAAAVVTAHLENKLPARLDPFTIAAKVLTKPEVPNGRNPDSPTVVQENVA
jgi:hypothetical protein